MKLWIFFCRSTIKKWHFFRLPFFSTVQMFRSMSYLHFYDFHLSQFCQHNSIFFVGFVAKQGRFKKSACFDKKNRNINISSELWISILHGELSFIFIFARHVCATSVKKFIDVRESFCGVSLKCKTKRKSEQFSYQNVEEFFEISNLFGK